MKRSPHPSTKSRRRCDGPTLNHDDNSSVEETRLPSTIFKRRRHSHVRDNDVGDGGGEGCSSSINGCLGTTKALTASALKSTGAEGRNGKNNDTDDEISSINSGKSSDINGVDGIKKIPKSNFRLAEISPRQSKLKRKNNSNTASSVNFLHKDGGAESQVHTYMDEGVSKLGETFL